MSEGGAREQVLGRVRAAIRAGAPGGQARAPGQAGAPGQAEAPGQAGAPGRSGAEVEAEYAALPRGYLRAHTDPAGHDIVALFAERAADYRAVVEQVSTADLAAAIARVLTARAAQVAGQGSGGVTDGGRTTSASDPPADGPGRASGAERGGRAGGSGRAGGAGSGGPAAGDGAWFAVPEGLAGEWLAEAGALRLVPDAPPLPVADLDACAGVVTGCAVAIAETGTIVLDHGPGQGRRVLTLVPDFHLVVVRHAQIAPDLADAIARMDPARPQTLIAGPSATSDIELIRVEGVHGPRTLHVLVTP